MMTFEVFNKETTVKKKKEKEKRCRSSVKLENVAVS